MPGVTQKRSTRLDPTYYPVDDDMGEGLLQRRIADQLMALLVRYFEARKVKALAGANQFIYWRQFAPTYSVAPDVYVLPGVAPDADVSCWKVWETGIVPSFALEIVSQDRVKDYEDAPRRYEDLGVRELVLFDPSPGTKRVRWQVYRPSLRKGFVRVETTDGDRVRSKVLGCWLRAMGNDGECRVRLGIGAGGDVLFATSEEAERAARDAEIVAREAEHAAREAENAAREAEHAAREAEHAARETAKIEREARDLAEAEVASLRAEIDRMRPR